MEYRKFIKSVSSRKLIFFNQQARLNDYESNIDIRYNAGVLPSTQPAALL